MCEPWHYSRMTAAAAAAVLAAAAWWWWRRGEGAAEAAAEAWRRMRGQQAAGRSANAAARAGAVHLRLSLAASFIASRFTVYCSTFRDKSRIFHEQKACRSER